ncbi:DUF397 domain-containing protein [Streptomyces mirabilis]
MTTPDNWQKSSFSGGGDGNACLELATPTPTPLSHLLHHIKTGRLGTPLV